jgi:hypothetical protein
VCAARKFGDENGARRLCRAALHRANRVGGIRASDYLEELAIFHALGEQIEKAVAVRDRQLALLAGMGRYVAEVEVHLDRCEILARLGQLIPEDRQRAQDAIQPLKAPKSYQERLDKL